MKFIFSVLFLSFVISSAYAAVKLPVCIDAEGTRVAVLEESSDIPSPAYSTQRSGRPVIIFNDALMQTIPNSRSFIGYVYLHECGHHALGHVLNRAQSAEDQKQRELAADCYAAKMARRLDAKNKNFINIQSVIQEVDTWPKDPRHPVGTRRGDVIAQCYQRG